MAYAHAPVLVGLLLLSVPHGARAQCGATLSQCRNCHEIAGARPVLAAGSPWHADHAFGDFCAQCHGGDPAAAEKAQAHAGVTAPLAEIELRCGPCHPSDADALAERYLRHRVAAAPTSTAAAGAAAGGSGGVLWGNVALAGGDLLLGAFAAGYVVRNERRLRATRDRGRVS
jgi:hypothetical protein